MHWFGLGLGPGLKNLDRTQDRVFVSIPINEYS